MPGVFPLSAYCTPFTLAEIGVYDTEAVEYLKNELLSEQGTGKNTVVDVR